MGFSIGAFSAGLFQGASAMADIKKKHYELKALRKIDEGAEKAAQAQENMSPGSGGAGGTLTGKDVGAGGPADTMSRGGDPTALPAPDGPQTRSASAADEGRAKPAAKPQSQKQKEAALATTQAEDAAPVATSYGPNDYGGGAVIAPSEPDDYSGGVAGPGGQLGFSFTRGLHTTQPGEPRFPGSPGGALGGYGFSLGSGLYRKGVAAAPKPAPPAPADPLAGQGQTSTALPAPAPPALVAPVDPNDPALKPYIPYPGT